METTHIDFFVMIKFRFIFTIFTGYYKTSLILIVNIKEIMLLQKKIFTYSMNGQTHCDEYFQKYFRRSAAPHFAAAVFECILWHGKSVPQSPATTCSNFSLQTLW